MQDDDQKPNESGEKETDRHIGKDVPFKKSYQPNEDNLDSSKPPRGSGAPPPSKNEEDQE